MSDVLVTVTQIGKECVALINLLWLTGLHIERERRDRKTPWGRHRHKDRAKRRWSHGSVHHSTPQAQGWGRDMRRDLIKADELGVFVTS